MLQLNDGNELENVDELLHVEKMDSRDGVQVAFVEGAIQRQCHSRDCRNCEGERFSGSAWCKSRRIHVLKDCS